MLKIRPLAVAIPVIAALPLLAACNSEGSTESASGSATSASSASAASSASETSSASADSNAVATPGTIEATATPTDGLAAGDIVTVTVKGLDPNSGYYSAFCAKEHRADTPVPDCTGDRATQGTQAWVTNKSGGTTPIADDGTATFDLTATPTGEAVDCTKQECVLKIFGDHSEGFEDIVDVPVTFSS